MTFFKDPKTLEELKIQYKDLVKKYHPDLGGSNAVMATINNEYEKLFNILKLKANQSKNKKEHTSETPQEFINIINKIITFEGLTIEILGSWIWLSGNTYPYKEEFKKLGFRWSKGRKKWYLGKLKTKNKYYKKQPWEKLKKQYNYSKINTKSILQLA